MTSSYAKIPKHGKLSIFWTPIFQFNSIAASKKEFVYKIKVNPIHTILKYGDYHDFMDIIGNGAVLKSSIQ